MQTQWRNENSYRKYPFADGVTLVSSSSGITLPKDVFVDASICPVALSGKLYLSEIDLPGGIVSISGALGVAAEADADAIADAMSTGELRFIDGYGRYFGTMIVGPGFIGVGGAHKFTLGATEFAAACITDVPGSGVEGFILPDGRYVSGDVVFEGMRGIIVTSEMEGSIPVITFNAVGSVDLPNCVVLPDPLKCIKVNVAPGAAATAALTISRVGTTVYIGHRAELSDVCDSNFNLPDTGGVLPPEPGDPCGPEPPPEPCPDNPPWPPDGACPPDTGRWHIVSGNSLMEVLPLPGAGIDAGKMMEYVNTNNLEPKSAQGIALRLRGVPNSVRID